MTKLENNIAKAQGYLERFRADGVLNQIDGQSAAGSTGETFESISPIDLKSIANVARGTAEDIDKAANAAKRAFAEWRGIGGSERKKILHAIADGIVARSEEIAFIECMDTGQSLRFMSKAALRGAENFRFLETGHRAPVTAKHCRPAVRST